MDNGLKLLNKTIDIVRDLCHIVSYVLANKNYIFFQKKLSKGDYYGTDHALKIHANYPIFMKNFLTLSQKKYPNPSNNTTKTSQENENFLFPGLLLLCSPLAPAAKAKEWIQKQTCFLKQPEDAIYGMMPTPSIAAHSPRLERRFRGASFKISSAMRYKWPMRSGPKNQSIYGMGCPSMPLMDLPTHYLQPQRFEKNLTPIAALPIPEKDIIHNVWYQPSMMCSGGFLFPEPSSKQTAPRESKHKRSSPLFPPGG
jgi:hypothetical protein